MVKILYIGHWRSPPKGHQSVNIHWLPHVNCSRRHRKTLHCRVKGKSKTKNDDKSLGRILVSIPVDAESAAWDVIPQKAGSVTNKNYLIGKSFKTNMHWSRRSHNWMSNMAYSEVPKGWQSGRGRQQGSTLVKARGMVLRYADGIPNILHMCGRRWRNACHHTQSRHHHFRSYRIWAKGVNKEVMQYTSNRRDHVTSTCVITILLPVSGKQTSGDQVSNFDWCKLKKGPRPVKITYNQEGEVRLPLQTIHIVNFQTF